MYNVITKIPFLKLHKTKARKEKQMKSETKNKHWIWIQLEYHSIWHKMQTRK